MTVLGLVLSAAPVRAERSSTRDGLERLEEVLELRVEDGRLDPRDVLPTILVAATPKYEESVGWFENAALATLLKVFGEGGLRMCEACMQLRTNVSEGRIEQSAGPVGLDEVIALDERYRGQSARARSAVWIHESDSGVSIRIVDLRTGQVRFAKNVDGTFWEQARTENTYRLAAEIERRQKGFSLTHAMLDIGVFPMQHIGFQWVDQWGDTNANLTGISLTVFDPVLGIGPNYHRILPWLDITVGAELTISVPTAVARAIDEDAGDIVDPIITGTIMARIPLFSSNYAGLITVSTNGRVALGITLLNTSLIPLIP